MAMKRTVRARAAATNYAFAVVGTAFAVLDVKVCAVGDTWSGLKLVIRRSQRSTSVKVGKL